MQIILLCDHKVSFYIYKVVFEYLKDIGVFQVLFKPENGEAKKIRLLGSAA